ncbi:PQQ-binding-like beta-propeller repeat protein [Streptomyces sp. NPDC049837]|uniref:outer membrane protein assembly factor BamB family protein n=1 Tax=Streptomyces sp. NPDC049837 TaxID=3155277 RepID=UPI00343D0B2D
MSGRTLAKALTTTAVVLTVIGSITAWFLSYQGYLPGDAMVRTWTAAKDRPTDDTSANNTWVVGDVAVRSRFDAVTGFGIADGQDGKKLWEYVPPGRTRVCGSARHADASVLLVAYGEEGGEFSDPAPRGKGCATVLALDLKDGRELWTAQRKVATGRFDEGSQFMDAGGDIAVIAHDHRDARQARTKDDHTSLRAVDLRTGKPRWTAAMPDKCGTYKVAVGKEQVFAVLECGGKEADEFGIGSTDGAELNMAAFDRATGALNWKIPMDARLPLDLRAMVSIESTDPLVLAVGRSGSLDSGTYLSFGEDGRPRPRIEFTNDHGKIDAADPTQTAIVGERMYALAGWWQKGEHHNLVAFDLTTGETVWKEPLDEPAAALLARGDRITVLVEWSTQASDITDLFVFDAGNGEELDERHFRGEVPGSRFYEHEGRLIAAGSGGGLTFTAFERW